MRLDTTTSRNSTHRVPRTNDLRPWSRSLGTAAALAIVDEFQHAPQTGRPRIDVVDLFCGCGGLSAGFDFVGRLTSKYRLAGAADINPYSIRTYAANLALEPAQVDLAAAIATGQTQHVIDNFDLRATNRLVLLGGPPCQGFSSHQKKYRRNGDERNSLLATFASFAVAMRPEFIVFENVPELLTKKHWRHFKEMKAQLEGAGYFVRAQIHDLAGFGVPQSRFRALVMASRRPFEMPTPFLSPQEYRTVREAIAELAPVIPGQEPNGDPMHFCTRHRQSTIETIRLVPKDGGRRPAGVGPQCLDRVDGFRDVYGRMFWDRPSNTITGYARNPASGRYSHPEQDRGLTIREAACLQSFPKEFDFEGPFDDKFWQIGNAVPPAFAAYVAAHVLGEMLSKTCPDTMSTEGDVDQPLPKSFASSIPGHKNGRSK